MVIVVVILLLFVLSQAGCPQADNGNNNSCIELNFEGYNFNSLWLILFCLFLSSGMDNNLVLSLKCFGINYNID